MKVSKVKEILGQVFAMPDFEIRFDDGRCDDSAPAFLVLSKNKPYKKGYAFELAVRAGWISGAIDEHWEVSLNQCAADVVRGEGEGAEAVLAHVLRKARGYELFPCPEEELAGLQRQQSEAADEDS